MIELGDALSTMEKRDRKGNAVPFSIEFITADLKRGTGGEIKTMDNMVMVTPAKYRRPPKRVRTMVVAPSKGQNHYANMTRNIRQLNDTAIVKLHIWLITKFNNEQVVWHIMG